MSRPELDPVTEWPTDLQEAADASQAAHEAGRVESFTFDLTRVQLLTANQRLHFAPKAALTKVLRVQGFTAAVGKEPMGRAHLVVHIGWPDKRRRDRSNFISTIKPLLDGIVDAKLIDDDDDAHLIGPDLRSHVLGVRGVYRFRFDFTELQPPVDEELPHLRAQDAARGCTCEWVKLNGAWHKPADNPRCRLHGDPCARHPHGTDGMCIA